MEIFKVWEKYSWIMQRAFKCKEWWRIWVLKTFKIEIQRGNQIIQLFCRIGCPLEIRSPIINLLEFSTSEKSTPESWKMHWNLQNDKNDKEFWSLNLLKLKYRRGGKIIQLFRRIGSPKKLGHPYLICGNLKNQRKVFLNHAKCIET